MTESRIAWEALGSRSRGRGRRDGGRGKGTESDWGSSSKYQEEKKKLLEANME